MPKAIVIDPAHCVLYVCVCVLAPVHTRVFVCFQLEDTDSPADVPEEIEDNTTASQVKQTLPYVYSGDWLDMLYILYFFPHFTTEAFSYNLQYTVCVCVCFQLEELIKEVQVLREELRSRDKTIAQLTLQCQHLQQQHQREQMVRWCEQDWYKWKFEKETLYCMEGNIVPV